MHVPTPMFLAAGFRSVARSRRGVGADLVNRDWLEGLVEAPEGLSGEIAGPRAGPETSPS